MLIPLKNEKLLSALRVIGDQDMPLDGEMLFAIWKYIVEMPADRWLAMPYQSKEFLFLMTDRLSEQSEFASRMTDVRTNLRLKDKKKEEVDDTSVVEGFTEELQRV